MGYQHRVAKYTRKALPGQLPLFTHDMEPPAVSHDPTGMKRGAIAEWLIQHGTGRLNRAERTFLFGIVLGRALPLQELRRLSELHRRIGGRAIPGAHD